jgi:hypothetical protein
MVVCCVAETAFYEIVVWVQKCLLKSPSGF